jgi:hypothetical protein
MKDRPRFLLTLLDELGEQQSLSVERDKNYILSRLKHEGISFLMITLPLFSDGLEESLEKGAASPDFFQAFARKKNGCLPKFLSGFTKRVFQDDGVVRGDACADAIYSIRQVTRFFKKSLVSCSDARNKASLENYISTDEGLVLSDAKLSNLDNSMLDSVVSILSANLFRGVNRSSFDSRHGPGATAEKLSRNGRISIKQWPIRFEPYFPMSFHAIPNSGHISALRKIPYLFEEQEPPVRVVTVPKTLKGPRIIAIEPSHVQFVQQGVMRYMIDEIERNPLTRSSIHFRDQSINRTSAHLASISGTSATIDLSEASDRVSLLLTKKCFAGSPLLDFILTARSSSAKLPNGRVILLNKYASMGSALCFPVEAYVFNVLIQVAVHKQLGIQPSRQSIRRFSKSIHVYGDDIIVPNAWLKNVIFELEAYGLKVNARKSFSNSQFRESCGGDYFKGTDVKPVYLRIDPRLEDNALTFSDLLSLTSTSNQLYDKGLWKTCQEMRTVIERRFKRRLPVRSSLSEDITIFQRRDGVEGSLVFKSAFQNWYNRWHKDFNALASKFYVASSIKVVDPVCNDGISSLTAGLRNIGNVVPFDFDKSTKSHSFRQKSAWIR